MSYLEKLLEGFEVEWKTLGETAQILNGYAFKSSKYVGDGIRVIRISDVQKSKMSDKDLKFYPLETENEIKNYLLRENDLVMSLTGYVGRVAMLSKSDLPAGLNQRVACIRPRDKVLTRYLFHYLDRIEFETDAIANAVGGGQKNMSTGWLSKYQIPIPPLEIQKEIVRILDNFTELTAELTTRKKQYTFYREQLFCFDEEEVERKALKEMGEFQRGKRFVKEDMIAEGVPCIHYGEMYTHYGTWAKESKSFLSEELVTNKNLRVAEKGDVVIVAAGETIEDIGKGTAWLGDEGVVTHDACFSYKSPLNPKYVSYFTRTKQFHDQIKKHISSGKISAINAKGLEKVLIPIRSPEEQERIVTILDKFDILTTSISEGLPKEIELRKKQYEYYRDLLLTFPNHNIDA